MEEQTPQASPPAEDPLYAHLRAQSEAIVALSRGLDSNTRAMEAAQPVLAKASEALQRVADIAAAEAADRTWLREGVGKVASWVSEIPTVKAGVALAVSLLCVGLALWILTMLGVDTAQVGAFLGIDAHTAPPVEMTASPTP